MQFINNLKYILIALTLTVVYSPKAESTEECFENVSRAVFKFNMVLDDIVLEPLAKGYNKLPSPVKTGAGNFTSNIGTLLSIPNNVLQGNFKQLGHSVGSFTINTTRTGSPALAMTPREHPRLKDIRRPAVALAIRSLSPFLPRFFTHLLGGLFGTRLFCLFLCRLIELLIHCL